MNIKVNKIPDKSKNAKKKNSTSQIIKTDFSQITSSPIDHILYLQRTIGNHAVQRFFESGSIQAKLKIGQPGDKYEQAADRMAEQVMQMPEPQVQQLPEEEGKRGEEIIRTKDNSGQTSEVTTILESRIQSLRGGGRPLPKRVRSFFEPRFSCDFSKVRIHNDTEAGMLNRALSARAFTTGHDIFFRQGTYNPGSSDGRELLAHELAHVVQQTGGEFQSKLIIGQPRQKYEQEQDRVSDQALRSLVPVFSRLSQLNRECEGSLTNIRKSRLITAMKWPTDIVPAIQMVPMPQGDLKIYLVSAAKKKNNKLSIRQKDAIKNFINELIKKMEASTGTFHLFVNAVAGIGKAAGVVKAGLKNPAAAVIGVAAAALTLLGTTFISAKTQSECKKSLDQAYEELEKKSSEYWKTQKQVAIDLAVLFAEDYEGELDTEELANIEEEFYEWVAPSRSRIYDSMWNELCDRWNEQMSRSTEGWRFRMEPRPENTEGRPGWGEIGTYD